MTSGEHEQKKNEKKEKELEAFEAVIKRLRELGAYWRLFGGGG
jgi:hypothetical protein